MKLLGFPGGSAAKNTPAKAVRSLGREDPLKEQMATHSSILAWRIPWTEEPVELQSIELQKSQTRLSDQTTTNEAPRTYLAHSRYRSFTISFCYHYGFCLRDLTSFSSHGCHG